MPGRLSTWKAAGVAVVALAATLAPQPSQARVAEVAAAAPVATDGRLVAADANNGQVKTLNPDGTGVLAITPAGDQSFHPAWAPDGSQIAFASNHGGGDFRIYSVAPDGGGFHQVGTDPDGYAQFTPGFTPDGTHLLFARCLPDPPGGCAIYSMRTDGSGKHRLTPYGHHADFFPDVSPDGRRIAFTRFDFHGVQVATWVMRADGTGAHAVTAPALEGAHPRWTPDGRHLLITSLWAHLGENIYRMRDDGSGLTRLSGAAFPHNSQAADPSPSGSKIVFSDDRAYPRVIGNDLTVMNANGSGKHRITRNGRFFDAGWSSAPLASARTARSPFTIARPRTTGRVAQLPRWLTSYGAPVVTGPGTSRWSR